MKTLTRLLPLLFALSLPVHAAVPPASKIEIDALLDFISHSGCNFYRNGSWHDSQSAASHVRDKYLYFSARQQIDSTEDFIARAATKSSFSGWQYKVKCPGSPEQPSANWLLNELKHERAERR
jgi:hypothetical protein